MMTALPPAPPEYNREDQAQTRSSIVRAILDLTKDLANYLKLTRKTNGQTARIESGVDNVGLHLANTATGGLDYSIQSTGGTSGWGQGRLVIASGAGSGSALHLAVDWSGTAGETRLMLWDVSAGTMVRVTRGAADSGGTGFRVLRIPN